MKPIKFKESNTEIKECWGEYKSFPAFYNSEEGTVSICYKLSFRESLKLLFSRKLWVGIETCNKSIQRQVSSVYKGDIVKNNANDILLLDS